MAPKSLPSSTWICAIAILIANVAMVSEAVAQAAGEWKSGQQVFAKVCAYCHTTGIAPELRGRQLPTAYITDVVKHGRLAMPAFRPTDFTPAELEQLANMLENSPQPEPTPPPEGAR
ncbi:cytochrome c [Magnetospirillum sp. 15-1]|uniref:c-type cytochrome n=1 Tax=Magnetospirillum sp. 15-1 TaxID=1979370 RepID=UPI0018D53824|nr:cytochrome c [Magnetospirillum sp. 15-1]